MKNSIVELNKINKNYSTLEVLANLSLYVNPGEIVSIFGPSGCGKTTIFRMIAGLLNPDKGEVFLKPDFRVGYVFQEPRLLPWKTLNENLAFVQQNYLSEDEALEIRNKLFAVTGLEDFKDSYPAQLSGGMKQRVELIRGLSIKPDLLLMDEPFKSVDVNLKIALRKMILKIWESTGLSIFLITHDPEEAVMMSNRIYTLSQKPCSVLKELNINTPQNKRSLKDKKIYDFFVELLENGNENWKI